MAFGTMTKCKTVICMISFFICRSVCQHQGVVTRRFTALDPGVGRLANVFEKIIKISRNQCATLCASSDRCSGFYSRDSDQLCLMGEILERSATEGLDSVRMYRKVIYSSTDTGYRGFSYDSKKYILKVSGTSSTWIQASTACKQDGGSLIYANGLTDFRDNFCLRDVLYRSGAGCVEIWVGLRHQNGDWAWDHNGVTVDIDEFEEELGEPADDEDRCVKFCCDLNTFIIADCDVSKELYVCEMLKDAGTEKVQKEMMY